MTMNKNTLLRIILSAQLFQGLSFAGAEIPKLPPKEKEELDGSETEAKRRKAGSEEDEDLQDEPDLADRLTEYLEQGDLENARALLELHLDDARELLSTIYHGHPLRMMVRKGNIEAIALLLRLAQMSEHMEALLIPDDRDSRHRTTVLHDAVEQGRFELVELLLASPFADRFYLFEEGLMQLPWYNLNPLSNDAIANRIFMRRLIVRYRPSFAQVEVPGASRTARLEVAFMDADMPRLREFLMTPINIPMLDTLISKFRQRTTADEFNDFYMNHVDFMAEFARLRREVEDGTYFQANLAANEEHNDLQPESLRRVKRKVALENVAQLEAYWETSARRYRTAQMRAFNQRSAFAVSNVLMAILLRKISQ